MIKMTFLQLQSLFTSSEKLPLHFTDTAQLHLLFLFLLLATFCFLLIQWLAKKRATRHRWLPLKFHSFFLLCYYLLI